MMIPPAPEMAYQASARQAPLISIQPESLVAQQMDQLTKVILTQMKK